MFQFRKALLDDVPQIAHIHVSSWANAYQSLMPAAYIECHTSSRREALWHKIIFNGLSDVFVAEADSRLHGFLSCDRVKEDGVTLDNYFVLSSLYVRPESHRHGVGSGLYQTLENFVLVSAKTHSVQIRLWVLDTNINALRFYRRLGFNETGKQLKEDVFSSCLTDLEMIKVLQQ